jgi:hypothetical protein
VGVVKMASAGLYCRCLALCEHVPCARFFAVCWSNTFCLMAQCSSKCRNCLKVPLECDTCYTLNSVFSAVESNFVLLLMIWNTVACCCCPVPKLKVTN